METSRHRKQTAPTDCTIVWCEHLEKEFSVDQICRNLVNEVEVKLYNCLPQKPYSFQPNSPCLPWLHIIHTPSVDRSLWHYASDSCWGATFFMTAHPESLTQHRLPSPPIKFVSTSSWLVVTSAVVSVRSWDPQNILVFTVDLPRHPAQQMMEDASLGQLQISINYAPLSFSYFHSFENFIFH